jgi:hypothetical protein
MVSNNVLLFSVVFKFIAMIIGVLGNIIVIIYTILLSKEKTATSYLVGNLAVADLLMCLIFYPIWIIEFLQTMLHIDNDQDLFSKLSRSTSWSLLFASVATLLAITVDRYLYIVKPLKYPLIQRRLDSRPQSIMGIERLFHAWLSLTVDCRGVNISLTTKPIWKLSNDKSVRLRYFVKSENSMLLLYCCIVAIIIMTCVLLYRVYLF